MTDIMGMENQKDHRSLYGVTVRTVPESRPKIASNGEIEKWGRVITALSYARDCLGPGERAYYAQIAECLAYAMSRSDGAKKESGNRSGMKQSELAY